MMYYYKTTQTPNSLFDIHLKILSKSELKVLLTVIRKTVGIIDITVRNKRIERAWISQRLFSLCTGLSRRAVSTAIDSLVLKDLIIVTNQGGHILKTKNARKGASRLYFSSNSLLEGSYKKKEVSEIICDNPVKKVHTIKQTLIKQSCENISLGIKKLSDKERILQIIHSQNTST
ncbi:hypothetical protein BX611_2348 [Lutibacter oceani]|uniref:Uncharacterized protein n=1 Tax=Lutibacter oceani TaxID=1853311 RepID=A0A3D9RUC0_9FLAO|nr:hypothetical protein [Lutibacter oceani]REE80696.1 hypothetical protein BX611_2348 [Lutibacter oceani]